VSGAKGPPPRTLLEELVVSMAGAAADVARYCDRAEHCDEVDREWVLRAGDTCRTAAFRLSRAGGVEIRQLYAARLDRIEENQILGTARNVSAAESIRNADTLRALQTAQAEHDRVYHPDVYGLSRINQLRHYSFHVTKLVGAIADLIVEPTDWEDFFVRRVPDMLLFGIKLPTVMGQNLSEEPLVPHLG
jgi:hypothetical protein